MKAYIIVTGIIFALLVVMHVWRLVAEGPRLVTDPVFIVFTVLSAALTVWAWRLIRLLSR